jgi:hypothetical protein
MSSPAKFVAIIAAVGVLVVLITPAPDELPCTASHKAHLAPAHSVNAISVLFQPIFTRVQPIHSAARLFDETDLLSLTCTLLC